MSIPRIDVNVNRREKRNQNKHQETSEEQVEKLARETEISEGNQGAEC